MRSKNYILMQLKHILMDRKEYSEERATAWVEKYKDKTVYELLVMKKDMSSTEKECRAVGVNSSIWYDEKDD